MAPGSGERPVIGLTAYDELASWGHWHTQASLVPTSYVRSLADAGASPVILPVQEEREETLDALVRRLDGLVLTGGPYVDPARYGAEPHPRSQPPRLERDELAYRRSATPDQMTSTTPKGHAPARNP